MAMWTFVSLMVTVAGLAFTAGAYMQSRRGVERRLKEGHQHVHRDISELKEEINGKTQSRIENCPICGGD